MWHKLSRWRRKGELQYRPSTNGLWQQGMITAGRLVCDTYLNARELTRETSYTLGSLAKKMLKAERQPIPQDEILNLYSTKEGLAHLAAHTTTDAAYALRICWQLQILPLTKELTNLAGNLWSKSLQNARAERIEYLLVHEFRGRKFVVPDKGAFKGKKGGEDVEMDGGDGEAAAGGNKSGPRRKKAEYSGGMVLEPKPGLYDEKIIMLDFNSLYPSIIREYNLCFTTVDIPEEDGKMAELPEKGDHDGILPEVLRRLLDTRIKVKALLANEQDPARKVNLDIRQKALKLTSNSLYGCLGFSNSRFYAKHLAALKKNFPKKIFG
jgi:DNA polymerase alpha subunit A